MSTLLRILGGLIRLIAYVAMAAVVLAIAVVLVIGFAPFATRLAVEEVAKLASTPDRTITISEPSGLLTGKLRAGAITISDTKGVFAEIRNLSVDWSPAALLSGTFRADRVAAERPKGWRSTAPR
jgi:translocation and assembly module TamB